MDNRGHISERWETKHTVLTLDVVGKDPYLKQNLLEIRNEILSCKLHALVTLAFINFTIRKSHVIHVLNFAQMLAVKMTNF